MKKILLVIAIAIGLWSCQKEETLENVTFKLDYSLDKGVNMTRAGEDLYASFYENFVKTKKVGHPSYELTFYKGETVVAKFSGEWDATLVTLPEGTYRVKGESKSNKNGIYKNRDNEHLSNLALDFDEDVTISKNTTSLVLNPTYGCYIVFADKTLFTSIKAKGVQVDYEYNSPPTVSCAFFEAGPIYYIFLNNSTKVGSIAYTAANGNSGELTIKTLGFEHGKYYCLDAVATGYQLPPMENGF